MHKIYFSSSENMTDVQDNSVQLMVTSPPYWDLKDYEVDNQIGYKDHQKIKKFIKKINEIKN